jgi:hypothetical protein
LTALQLRFTTRLAKRFQYGQKLLNNKGLATPAPRQLNH